MKRKCNIKHVFFVFMLILSLIFESTAPYISFANKPSNNNETVAEETISTNNLTGKNVKNSVLEKNKKLKNESSENINNLKKQEKVSNEVGLDGVINNEKPNGTIQKGDFNTPVMTPRSARSSFRNAVSGVPIGWQKRKKLPMHL